MIEKRNKPIEVKIGSDRSFGIVFGTLFFVIALIYFNRNLTVFGFSFGASVIFFIFTWLSPNKLRALNSLWFKFGLVLGSIINPILLGVVFLLTVLPIGILLKSISRDPLSKSINKNASTYWDQVSDKRRRKESMLDQF